jgi:tetratricopeptide (TPR) repeat protein
MNDKLRAAAAAISLSGLILVGCTSPSEGPESQEAGTTEPAGEAEPPEAYSLSGEPLYRMEIGAERLEALEADLQSAQAAYDADPDNEENIIWLGRRLAYLWRYRDAVDAFTKGIELHPNSYKLYRHRGHRYITLRMFDEAVADLEKAASLIEGVPDEVEPDGAPNEANIPRSTSHSNIWYHLGLAYYLKGQFEDAARAYERCMEFSKNDDMIVATADWQYMTLRRLGREADAEAVLEPIKEEMDVLENHSYHRRLLMYRGIVPPSELLATEGASALDLATQGYGVANWYLVNGDEERAKEIFEQILEGSYWAAFGYIAAEADVHRTREPQEG